MIGLELELPETTYKALQEAANQAQKSEAEIALTAIQAFLNQFSVVDPLLGLFSDDMQLIDQIEMDAMKSREEGVLRVDQVNGQ